MDSESEIVRKYEFLTERSRDLVNQMNEIWQTREKLRQDYKELTGKDISERPRIK